LRPYSPGGVLNAFPRIRNRRVLPLLKQLQLIDKKHLFLATPLAFAPQRQEGSSLPLSPLAFPPISTHFTAPPVVPQTPIPLERCSTGSNSTVEPMGFHFQLTPPPTRPLSPMIPNNVRTVRLTAAAGTNLARASSGGRSKFAPSQQEFTTRRPSSSTRRRSFRVSPIDEDSRLQPPVGVWPVSQCQ